MKKRLLFVLSLSLLIAALVAPQVQAGGGAHCEPNLTDERTTTVTLAKNCFFPTIARVDVGDEVTFVSKDPVPHTITGAIFVFGDMDEVMQGDERRFTFDEEGIYPYVCIIHPGMAGAIVVGDGKGAGGAVSDTSFYGTNSAEEAAEEAATAAEPTAATTSNTLSWSIVPAALGALIVLAVLSLRPYSLKTSRTKALVEPSFASSGRSPSTSSAESPSRTMK